MKTEKNIKWDINFYREEAEEYKKNGRLIAAILASLGVISLLLIIAYPPTFSSDGTFSYTWIILAFVGGALLVAAFVVLLHYSSKIKWCEFQANLLEKELYFRSKGFTEKEIVTLLEQYINSCNLNNSLKSIAAMVALGGFMK